MFCNKTSQSQRKKNKPALNVSNLSVCSDFIYLLNGLQSALCDIPIISLRPVTLPFKLKGWILQTKQEKQINFYNHIFTCLFSLANVAQNKVNKISHRPVSYPFHVIACMPWSTSPYVDSSSSWSSCDILIYRIGKPAEGWCSWNQECGERYKPISKTD